MKTTGTHLKGFKLAKDGKTPVRDEKKYDLITQMKKKHAPRKRFQGVPADKREFRG